MTPKEEASGLVDKNLMILANVYDSLRSKKDMAKSLALICIDDKIISINKFKHPTNSSAMNRRVDREVKRLEEVKEEINKL